MKKLISLLALASFLIPNTTNASLWSYYNGNLPTIQERSITYSQFSDDKYTGSAEQNIFLESKLKGGMLGATTKIKLTDTNAVTPAATSTPTANMIPIASSSGYLLKTWILDDNIFGDGRDGDVVINSTVTATRDMFYNNLTLTNTPGYGILNTNGYRIYVKGTLTLQSSTYIRRNGLTGGTGYGGADGSYAGCGGGGGGSGGNGGTGGVIILVYDTLTNTGSITTTPGTPGAGGTTGLGGANGVSGNPGRAGVIYYKKLPF